MSKAHRSLLERLDASVAWTGIPQMAEGRQRRRPFRVLPTVALTLSAVGVGLTVLREDARPVGFSLVMLGFAMSAWLPAFGPLRLPNEPMDERERATADRSHLFTDRAIAVSLPFALIFVAQGGIVLRWSGERLGMVVLTLAFAALVMRTALPTLHASLTIAPLVDEEG